MDSFELVVESDNFVSIEGVGEIRRVSHEIQLSRQRSTLDGKLYLLFDFELGSQHGTFFFMRLLNL